MGWRSKVVFKFRRWRGAAGFAVDAQVRPCSAHPRHPWLEKPLQSQQHLPTFLTTSRFSLEAVKQEQSQKLRKSIRTRALAFDFSFALIQ